MSANSNTLTSLSGGTAAMDNSGGGAFHGVDAADHDGRATVAAMVVTSSVAGSGQPSYGGALTLDGHPLNQFDASAPHPGAHAGAQGAPSAAREAPRRKGGRAKDMIWNETTILEDKTVMCNHCNTVIHRYGCAKVERVRSHFQNRCLSSTNQNGGGNGGGKKQKTAHDQIGGANSVAQAEMKANRRMDYITKVGMFKRKFAQWVYATGQSFDDVENDFLVSALRILRADVPLPTRDELENELLDLESTASLVKVNKALLGKACCLSIENWTDSNGVQNTNYATLCENTPYFLESAPSSLTSSLARESGVAELSADEVENVLAKHKKCLFYAVITPETAMISRLTRERIQKKNPQCVFYYGCVLHALRLLVNDICLTLPWMEKTRESVYELLKVVHTNQKLRSQLPTLPRVDDKTSQGADRIFESFEAILSAEKELYAVVSRRDFVEAGTLAEKETLKQIQDFVLGENFVQDLNRASKLILPLQQQLHRFESDRVSLSQVYHSFLELVETYGAMEWVSKKDKALISSCVKERLGSIYGDAHGVAYMLDPMYLGVGMDPMAEEDVKSFIVSYCNTLEPAKVLAQLEKYKAMVLELKECNSTYWKMLELGDVRAFDFWIERRQFPQLQQLAWAVFSLPNTSTAPTRAFSAQCQLIHSRFHAKLSPEKLQKLTQVYCNAKTPDLELSPMAAMTEASLFTLNAGATSAVL